MPQTEKDFDGLLFNPLAKKPMLKVYPQLNEICPKEGNEDDFDIRLRYVCALYDPKSPLRTTEKDPNYRKLVAAKLAGFDMNNEELLDEIYTGEDEAVFFILTKFLFRFVREKEYLALCAIEYKFAENISELLTPIKGDTNSERLEAAKKKSLLASELDTDMNRIEALWERIYGDKDVVKQVKKKRLTPETMAG
jgi:hypothetical protein